MSTNGKEKLIAKLQHFYDSLINIRQVNEDYCITTNDLEEKAQRKIMADCYQAMSLSFADVFKEFLYNAERDDT